MDLYIVEEATHGGNKTCKKVGGLVLPHYIYVTDL